MCNAGPRNESLVADAESYYTLYKIMVLIMFCIQIRCRIPNRMEGEIAEKVPEFPTAFVNAIMIVFIVQIVVGLISNITVMIFRNVLKRSKVSPSGQQWVGGVGTSSSEQAIVNATLLTNLNVADMIICTTSIPMALTYTVMGRDNGLLFCLCNEAFLSFSTSSSALNLLVISINRHQTILAPFKRTFKVKHLPYILLTTWALSFLGFGLPFLLLTVNSWENISDAHAQCFDLLNLYTPGHHFFFECYYVLIYFVSNVIVVLCYCRIFRVAKSRINTRTTIVQSTSNNADQTNAKNREKTMTHMTLMIVITFTVCWGPHAITSIVTMVIEPSYRLSMVRIVCLTLAYFAPLIHPLLYVFMRRSFRAEVRNFFSKSEAVSNKTLTHARHTSITAAKEPSRKNSRSKELNPTESSTLPTVSSRLNLMLKESISNNGM
ncbi:hypothetical protein CAPTEDRAFT_185316 [Capitella teleta]|uniref:G-protein coupled receptors family 1 profile domain-containing protein n=1 Tax=Capitella teleta TaxID=283909 RepID=R7TIP5_CAPTE|nr:hypothetical protein CAPTEDRAFT_185316 [Capitella teleta]|eukprot:ELT91411.1 hypothetical protein CAPTEDRAFT_185316 [Capitella teleta]